MENSKADRRGFLRKMVAVVGGLAAVPMLSRPAQAGRSHRRGYGYGYRRSSFRRGWGGYGYRGFYGPGYYYGRGYYRAPYGGYYYGRGYYGAPYGGYYSPYYGGWGGYGYPGYGGYGVGVPMLKRDEPRAIDALSLLEC
jgi:hypothetical protein